MAIVGEGVVIGCRVTAGVAVLFSNLHNTVLMLALKLRLYFKTAYMSPLVLAAGVRKLGGWIVSAIAQFHKNKGRALG